MPLLEFNNKGIYCKEADVYIDPWKPVKRALITHGHSDHARRGSTSYISSLDALPVIKYRLRDINIQGVAYGESFIINGVKFSFHPAGHIIGSSQIKVEHKGEIWVVSGDYKVDDDLISGKFEPIKCHTFITECTFGLPVYQWPDQFEEYRKINEWWAKNQSEGVTSVIIAYSLGKAQRVIKHLDQSIGKVFTHGAVENINAVLRNQGFFIPDTKLAGDHIDKKEYKGNIIVTPSSGSNNVWMQSLGPHKLAMASGWMNIRGIRRQRAADRGFVLSDHADWTGLLEAILATGAENIITTHGYTNVFARHLSTLGLNAFTEKTQYEGEVTIESPKDS